MKNGPCSALNVCYLPFFRFWDLKWALKAHFRPNFFFKLKKWPKLGSGYNILFIYINKKVCGQNLVNIT